MSAVASALISSRLDQLNSILYGTSLKHIARLQRIQHAAARVVMNQHSRTSKLSSSKLLKQLHWLPIEWHIQFKLATLTFKALRTGYPPYLSNLLQTPRTREVSALIQFSLSFSSPSQSKIWMSCFSIIRTESLEFITH